MKRMIVLLVMTLLIAGCGGADDGSASSAAGSGNSGGGDSASSPAATVRIEASGGEDVEVRVEIADDTQEMARGLMGRTALADDAGMLFVYPEERDLSFWMKDTLIPLSIAFMDSEGRIVDIQDMRALDDVPPHYNSAEPAQYALEVDKGFFDEHGVEVGDQTKLPT